MQTFLPYASFTRSAQVLDYRRLGKQRVETLQLINAIEGRTKGWVNHPAAVMWRNHVDALKIYGNAMIHEWIRRGYKNTMPLWFEDKTADYPHWLGRPDFHASHRSNLLRKDPAFYGKYGWSEPDNLEYVWPSETP